MQRWRMLLAFVRARWWPAPTSRHALLVRQHRRLVRFFAQDLGRIPFYAGHERALMDPLPVIDKATMLAQFERFNRLGLDLAEALAAAARAERGEPAELPGGVTAGLSSGTSGARGVFLVSPAERATWAGVMLARVLSPGHLRQLLMPWRPPLRVAFLLRADSPLYQTVGSRRLQLHWLPLTQGVAEQRAHLEALRPQILVAPASVLGSLARACLEQQWALHPAQVISVAEVLEDDDAAASRAAWGVAPSQIYQGTEGFLGASCELGHVHLNEEQIHVELEWLDEARTRCHPVVTDFTRRTQAFVRFRLDDVLQPLAGPCACGRHTLALRRIEGRADDRLWQPDAHGTLQPVYPDALRHAIAGAQAGWPASHALTDYRLEQHGAAWRLLTRPALSPERQATLTRALVQCCASAQLIEPAIEHAAWVDEPPERKRRRIRCIHPPEPHPCAS
jgi:putative adenylate-forming enzyme